MRHLKETVIDGVKFVLIPAELHDKLTAFVVGHDHHECSHEAIEIINLWEAFDPEIFNGQ